MTGFGLSSRARWSRRRLLRSLAALPAGMALGSLVWQPEPRVALAADKPRPGSTRARPNLLLISVDSLRADHLGSYGYTAGITPNLDRLAAEGVLVSTAYTAMPSTNPAHAALLSGTYPGRSGVFVHMVDKLDPDLPTMAEALQARGFQTAGIFSWHSLEGAFSGFQRGFETYRGVTVDLEAYLEQQDEPTIPRDQRLDRLVFDTSALDADFAVSEHIEDLIDGKADITTDAALRWLDRERQPDRPFFLWLHYFDPHYPYTPPHPRDLINDGCDDCLDGDMPTIRRIIAEWNPNFSLRQTAHLRALYDREISFTDEHIGRLLSGLRQRKLDPNTVVVLTSDHGESFGEHDLWLHGGGLYRHEVQVPLLLRYPGHLPAGRVIGGPARLVDIMPTLLELAEVPVPETVQGASLLSLLSGSEPDGQRHALAVSGEPSVAVLTREWQLIYRPPDDIAELYRLGTDPAELDNLAPPPADSDDFDATDAPVAASIKREPRPEGGDPLRSVDPLAYQGIVKDLLSELRSQGLTAHPALTGGVTEA